MSASAEASATPEGNGHESRLEQPKDAVPMENMPLSAHSVEPTAISDLGKSNGAHAIVDDVSGQRSDETPTANITAKGKEKGDDPAPPTPLKEAHDSTMAIGPAQDEIKAANITESDTGVVCNITLLLTTGSRHPYKINASYLSKRNVPIPEELDNGQPDPFSISIYTLKELILREWRSDWEAKPSSPSSIRLIYFGKLLDDKEPLKAYKFLADSPNVVHMNIRPQDLDEEEPRAGKNASAGGGDVSRERGGCCVIL